MKDNQENVVNMFPEQETASVTDLNSKDLTMLDRLRKTFPSARKALSFSAQQILKALFSLTLPIILFLIGIGIICTYIVFGVSAIMLVFSDETAKSLQMVVMAVMMFIFFKMVFYILAWIKFKLGLV